MELPKRAKGDEYLPDQLYTRTSERLRTCATHADIRCLIMYAFDYRTRLLPFIYADKQMVPAGARAVAAALFDAGFTKTRIVLQQWNPNVRPSSAIIDGRPPEILLVSAMQIHSAPAYELITDALSMGDDRPLILAGGPKVIYEPEQLFSLGADGNAGADVCVTGEEFILLELLELLSELRGSTGTMRKAFEKARRDGLLNKIPGLVYEDPAPPNGRRPINTGIQRLLRNLDELPSPVLGYRMLERPHKKRELQSRALADNEVMKYSRIASLVTTHGCKFACNYCPIPAYNQRTFRTKSAGRMVQEAAELHEAFGYRYFFGTDDNFFNNRQAVQEYFEAFAKSQYKGEPVRHNFRYGTEATEFDVYRNRDLLPLAKRAGLFAVWFGIEDMTAELINKGQTPEKTKELFGYMQSLGIAPMAMMMHYDAQPLLSRGDLRGLLNQVRFLYDAGAVSYQCTILSPAVGTRVFEDTFKSGQMVRSINGTQLDQAYYDGNHAVAAADPLLWRRQLHLLAAYFAFYNPVNFLRRCFSRSKNQVRQIGYQIYGNLAMPKTAWEMLKWAGKLATGRLKYWHDVPAAPLPVYWVNEPGGQQPVAKAPAVLHLRPELGAHSAAGM